MTTVISIPLTLIFMSTFSLAYAFINTSFKSLSIFAIAIATCRLGLQYNAEANRVDYVLLTFWLVIEAAVAVIVASVSSYRLVVLDHLKDHGHGVRHRHLSLVPRARCVGAHPYLETEGRGEDRDPTLGD